MSLFWRALATLSIGMALAAVVAALLVRLLRAFGEFAPHDIGDGGLGALTSVNYATFGIGLMAGVAAILSLETNASTVVGVAISVTTIPALYGWERAPAVRAHKPRPGRHAVARTALLP